MDENTAENPARDETTESVDYKAEARKWESRSKKNLSELEQVRNDYAEMKRVMEGIGKAFGVTTDESENPKALAEKLTAAQQQAAQAQREAAVIRAAVTAGANPDALLDSARFLRTVEQLDPSDSQAITAAITAAVEANPAYSATPPGAGYGDTTAGNRSGHGTAPEDEALRVLGF